MTDDLDRLRARLDAELIDRLKATLRPQEAVIQQARIVQAAIALVEAFPEKGFGRQEWIELVQAVDAYTGKQTGVVEP